MATAKDKTVKRTVKKEVEKTVKKNKGGAIAVLFAFLFFAAAGFLTAMLITKNDGLKLYDDQKSVSLKVGESYEEKGASFTVFGKDVSSLVTITVYDEDGNAVQSPDTSAEAEYSVVYSVDSEKATDFFVKLFIGKYKNYKQVRQITVTVA